MTCRVLLADDVQGIRELWRLYLEADPGIEIVGEAGDGNEALAAVEVLQPDVLVLDLSMPERDGLEVIPVVRTASPGTAVVVASGFSASRMARIAFAHGAIAYFEKGDVAARLLDLVKGACPAGEAAG